MMFPKMRINTEIGMKIIKINKASFHDVTNKRIIAPVIKSTDRTNIEILVVKPY